MKEITIHFDFTDGTEISYKEGREATESFTTTCLNFFCFDYLKVFDEITVVKQNGEYIKASELITDGYYTEKEIRTAHNIEKLLRGNSFNWKSPLTFGMKVNAWNSGDGGIVTGFLIDIRKPTDTEPDPLYLVAYNQGIDITDINGNQHWFKHITRRDNG